MRVGRHQETKVVLQIKELKLISATNFQKLSGAIDFAMSTAKNDSNHW
jgi:hypothetical protein